MSYAADTETGKIDVFKSIPWNKVASAIEIEPVALVAVADKAEIEKISLQPVSALKEAIDWNGKSVSLNTIGALFDDEAANEDQIDDFDMAEAPQAVSAESRPQSSPEQQSNSKDTAFEDEHLEFVDSDESDYESNYEANRDSSAFGARRENTQENITDNQDNQTLVVFSKDSVELTVGLDNNAQRISLLLLSKKSLLSMAKVAAVLVVLVSGLGVWFDHSAFKVAEQTKNPADIQSFLQSQWTYVWNSDAQLVLSNIEADYFLDVENATDVLPYKRYLRNFPNGQYVDDVVDLMGTRFYIEEK